MIRVYWGEKVTRFGLIAAAPGQTFLRGALLVQTGHAEAFR